MGQQSSETNIRLTKTERAIEDRENGNGSGNSSTGTAENKRGRGRPPKNRTGEAEEKLSGLAVVNQPKPVSIEVPGSEEKPKKAGRPKKGAAAPAAKVDSTQIQLLLVTISGVMASRPGMEVWNLSPQEAKQIADPLANILAKNAAVANAMGEHADAFALVAACFMVFLPKFIIWQAGRPKKPKQGEKVSYGIKSSTEPQQPKREVARVSESNDRRNANGPKNGHTNFGGQLSEIIPAVGGF